MVALCSEEVKLSGVSENVVSGQPLSQRLIKRQLHKRSHGSV